ncbi:MAG: hypothetical protein R8G66_18520 [Cytophagales bacterium]|nr:hypothetical protein [Cytophagales bacterium]
MKIFKRIAIVLVLIVLVFAVIFMIPIGDPQADHMSTHFVKIEEYLQHRDMRNTEVSQADVAWHLDHILKVIDRLYGGVEVSKAEDFPGSNFSVQKEIVFLLGDFPRGVAQAPESVTPPETILTEDIIRQLEDAKARISEASQLNPDQFVNHPVFGPMGRNEALRFIEIHTDHHFKIIEDILAE